MKTYSSQLNSGIIQLKRIAEGDKIKDELSIEQNQESTKTTVNRLESVVGKHRIRHVDILNDSKRLEQVKLIIAENHGELKRN